MKRFWILLILSSSMSVCWSAAPVMTDLTVLQRSDGSGVVDIDFTLTDADDDLCTITIQASNDSGSTWSVTPSSEALSGDIGPNISPGSCHIEWATQMDLPGSYGARYRIRLQADDASVPPPTSIDDIVFVAINDPGVAGHGDFTGQMSKYETTNDQYCQYLNAALAHGDITVRGNDVIGANGSNSGIDYPSVTYYNGDGSGYTYNGATHGGAARIHFSAGQFTVDSGFNDHPVTYVSWYGANAFAAYYGYRLPTEWEWQAVADYDGSYTHGCGVSVSNAIANYLNSIHPEGTTAVGSFGTYGYGMADMSGNVWEWTATTEGSSRVYRGGGWNNYDHFLEVDWRYSGVPKRMYHYVGFRVCR